MPAKVAPWAASRAGGVSRPQTNGDLHRRRDASALAPADRAIRRSRTPPARTGGRRLPPPPLVQIPPALTLRRVIADRNHLQKGKEGNRPVCPTISPLALIPGAKTERPRTSGGVPLFSAAAGGGAPAGLAMPLDLSGAGPPASTRFGCPTCCQTRVSGSDARVVPAETRVAAAFLWSPLRDLNPRPFDYKSNALPAELNGRLTRQSTACCASASGTDSPPRWSR